MSERDSYPPGVPCWVDTAQPDPEAATAFYAEVFGWEFTGPGPNSYYVATLRGRDVAGVSSLPEGVPPSWNTYIAVADLDAELQRASAAGGSILAGPFDAAPAGRLAVVRDPTGAAFFLWQAAGRHGAQRVNEPSAWAMSALHTDDAEAAKRFYGEVFGWETEAFGDAATLWRLPGYVGGEPEQPVPRDVVAVMAPLPPNAPPHWSVDFWIDDADAATARVQQSGGSVVVPPSKAGPFRSAALADPHGAVFSVSQLLR